MVKVTVRVLERQSNKSGSDYLSKKRNNRVMKINGTK